MSDATRFHHWPTVLYSNVEELMSDLSPSEQNIFRTQRGHILHPFSGAKMFARLFSDGQARAQGPALNVKAWVLATLVQFRRFQGSSQKKQKQRNSNRCPEWFLVKARHSQDYPRVSHGKVVSLC